MLNCSFYENITETIGVSRGGGSGGPDPPPFPGPPLVYLVYGILTTLLIKL